jgi:putative ABC transport system substrate-binding protein
MEYFIMAFRTIVKTFIALTLPIAVAYSAAPSTTPSYKIGVIQVIEHPALDLTRQGIRDELTAQGFTQNLEWSWDSAQGNPNLATQIAQKYMGQGVNLMVGIGTTVAQAALNAARDSQVAVVFASVTDPKGAKLIGNVTGVSNFVPTKDQFDTIMKILPTKKRIGVIFNPGEANSESLLAQMKTAAKEKGLELMFASASKTSEVTMAAQGLIGKVDAIFINNDNTALAALNVIGQICRENKIPLFASDGDLEGSGALALLGADQYEIGLQTGRMVAKIFRGEAQASDLKTQYPTRVNVEFNEKVAQDLGVIIPDSLKQKSMDQKGVKS